MLLLSASLLILPPTPAQAPQPPDDRGGASSDFNFQTFSEACANGSAAVQRWEALERARIGFERARGGANTLASAPVTLDAAGCVRLPGSGTRMPLDVMVDSHYYAARLFVGQFGKRRASRDSVLDALAAEIWSNLMPNGFRSEYGQSQMLTVRRMLAGSGGWYDSYDHSRFAHDVYHFYHRRWRGALLSGLVRDEDGDGCVSLGEYARSLCLQQRYMSSALDRTGRQTRSLRRVVRMLRHYQRKAV